MFESYSPSWKTSKANIQKPEREGDPDIEFIPRKRRKEKTQNRYLEQQGRKTDNYKWYGSICLFHLSFYNLVIIGIVQKLSWLDNNFSLMLFWRLYSS